MLQTSHFVAHQQAWLRWILVIFIRLCLCLCVFFVSQVVTRWCQDAGWKVFSFKICWRAASIRQPVSAENRNPGPCGVGQVISILLATWIRTTVRTHNNTHVGYIGSLGPVRSDRVEVHRGNSPWGPLPGHRRFCFLRGYFQCPGRVSFEFQEIV